MIPRPHRFSHRHLFSAALALAGLIFGSASTRAAEAQREQSAALAKLGEAYVAAFNRVPVTDR